MISLTCPCGNAYTEVPDDEIVGVPPSYIAQQFYCDTCKSHAWLEPHDVGLFSWEELSKPVEDTDSEILETLVFGT